jgi:HTH-type transcriptional regulator, sugar sensing transcriptional regulator
MFYPVVMIDKLMNFSPSRLEASAYVALLQEPGITGYRLSHILNKPIANIYKALKSLEHKGLDNIDISSKLRN